MKDIPYKIYLSEHEMPKNWYNLRADMKNKPAPLLNPGTLQPITAPVSPWIPEGMSTAITFFRGKPRAA